MSEVPSDRKPRGARAKAGMPPVELAVVVPSLPPEPAIEPAPIAELAPAPGSAPAPEPAQSSEQIIEAAASPAVHSDTPSPEPETLAPQLEDITPMATIMNETTAAAGATTTEATDKAQAMFGDMSARFKAAMEKSQKLGEELVELAKGNVEAMVASARVAAKGGEAIGQEVGEYGRKSLEASVAAMKSFAAVRSPTELFQLQSDFVKSSFDSAVAEASKLSESMLKIAGEAAQPLSSRYAVAAEKIKAATV